MKRVLRKTLIITLIILLINNFFISSFSAISTVPYLKLRSSGLSEEQRLAVVNAGNYLQTDRFSYLVYCLTGTNNFKKEATAVSNCNSSSSCSYHIGGDIAPDANRGLLSNFMCILLLIHIPKSFGNPY